MERNTGWIPWLIAAVTCVLLRDVTGLQFTPVGLSGAGDGECALILNGPGRSSSFDYSLNLLRGGNGFGYNGQHTCITYDAVNAAYLEARKRVQVAQPHGDYKPEDVATVGELLLDISVNLARTYGLSYEDIEKGLPLIDTSKTLIREVCPPFLSNVECRPGKYRRFDGLCTNLGNPTWGSTMQPFTRLIGPLYADGMTAPRISVTGNQLPLARVVSRTMHPDEGFHDHAGTVMVIAWGQFMDHDYTLTATPLDPLNRNDPEECCKRPPHLKNPYCNEIHIPEDDYFYRLFNVRCMDFVRGFPAARPGCRLGSRSQYNILTGVIDANTVYGVTEKFSRKLRSGYSGQMRMNPVFREYGLKDLLPLKLDIPDEGCTRPNRSMYCFEAGEIRVNEQLVLTCMHTLMAREHNRVAEGLAQVNPHWDDETLFQEARRINIAEVQHITYNEFLPILLGKEVMEKFGLLLQKDGYWDGHDPSVNPNVIDAFAAAAYRFGHSLLPTAVERWSKAHKFIASKRLSDLIRRPYDLYRAGVIDEYFMGLMNQVAQAMDDSITQEVTNHLFKKVGARYGMDLVSFNMQRGREFGLPGYMEFRKFCGLPGADTFDELFGSMPNETIKRYSTIFEHPHDVDLWSGGVSERPLPGSMLGPTFACIIATQFSYSRRGDRFWYELPNQPSSFTPEQLKEIRKSRLARVICDNTDLIDTIQLYPMVLPDHEINPRVPCRSGVLPTMDFTKWADHGSPHFQQSHQPFTNNLVESSAINPKLLNLANEAIHKKIIESNMGRHPYASLFKTQKPLKNIKILPPLLLKPQATKEVISILRNKRNIQNDLKNTTANENITLAQENNENVTKTANQENGTVSPVVDQVTQAITVTQISGTPPPNAKKDPRPVNYQPFSITSSDFQNNTETNQNFGQLEEIVDVGKFIQEKIKKMRDPNFQSFEKSLTNTEQNNEDDKQENDEVEEAENLEEPDENEEESQKAEHRQTNEDYDEEKEEIVNEEQEEIEPEHDKLIINVPQEFQQNQNSNVDEEETEEQAELQDEPQEADDPEDEQQNIQEEQAQQAEEEIPVLPVIPDSFAKHFIDMGAITENPEQLTHETRENTDANKEKTVGNLQINGEKFYLPLQVDEASEENEEIKEKNKYFDDIINHQFEYNKKLERELEYPDLDNEYEKYRESAESGYLNDKTADFSISAKPYVINLEGIFPYEKQNENDDDEYNYKDDVDVGTDKERVQQENPEEIEQEPQNDEKQEQQEEDEEREEYQAEDDGEDEENDKVSSDKKYVVVPKQEDSQINESKIKNKNSELNHLNEDKLKENIQEIKTVPPTENIVQALNKILDKKDAISRQQQIENPENYNTYWSLEYKVPNST